MTRARRIAAATVAYIKQKKHHRKPRKVWVKKWIQNRYLYGAYDQLLTELKESDGELFKNFVRMSATDFEYLLEKVKPLIQKADTVMRTSISPGERLAITLRFLATGDSYGSISFLFRVGVSTISRIIPECCSAIYAVLKDDYLKIPNTETQWLDIANNFKEKWNFPNCIGALDGKHISIKSPKNTGSLYYNYKGTFSIVLLGLVDANYKFVYVDIGCNGRVSDGGVYLNSSLYNAMEINSFNIPEPIILPGRDKPMPFVIVGDDAFSMKPFLMKPYSFRNQPAQNRIFNYRLSRARRVVENAFGLIAQRFRILRRPIELSPETTGKITSAICVLHNFLLTRPSSLNIYAPTGTFDLDNNNDHRNIIEGTWRTEEDASLLNLQTNNSKNSSIDAKIVREEFKEYFMSSEGEVSWQYQHI